MRRALAIVAVVAAATAFALTAAGAGDDDSARRFTIEFDNAFGLVEGADFKVAGVRAGTIETMRVDRRTKHALIGVRLDKTGFGSLRRDVFCETRPQSLIGEYFIDCRPGTDRRELPDGARIPISRTASTIPADLLGDVMRRPYRERLRIILAQLGVGVGARAEELNAAIRRASPALRETDQVLAVLARQNRVLRDLVEDGDEVIGDLAGNRRDVTRWVEETRDTARASAERREQIAQGLAKLPAFLRELRPTMAELGRAADAQAPTLVDLNASAEELDTLFDRLAPFARSTQANLRQLGGAARQGRPAMREGRPVVAELNRFSRKTPELAKNLSIVFKDLDDRDRAIEKDPRSPGGEGYTGFEALLSYVFDQAMAINVFDANGYMLKVNIFEGECSEYQNAESLKKHMEEDPEFYERCAAILGPNQLGVLQPDPTKGLNPPAAARRRSERRAPRRSTGERRRRPAPQAQRRREEDKAPPAKDLGQTVHDILDGRLPDIDLPRLDPLSNRVPDAGGALRGGAADRASREALLDYLLSP
ncbi:MAG TPA: MlaD family protein [Solirubrobacteraceae bacterium]|nr:MlaD family protein [Solirubrobacteraceae bacterium]